jgi:hypothetical protein
MDKKRMEDAMSKFDKAYFSNNLKEEYLQFSRFIQGAFISPTGWIIDTGNYQNVNKVLIEDIYYKIRKHPLIWKIFFKVA